MVMAINTLQHLVEKGQASHVICRDETSKDWHCVFGL